MATKNIFGKLEVNQNIVLLDYSNNMLGKCAGVSEAIGSFLRNNSRVLHLDLSFNNFSIE